VGTGKAGEREEKKVALSSIETAGYTLFIALFFLGIFLINFGFPGTVVVFLDAFAFALWNSFVPVGFAVLAVLLLLVAAAEGGDFWLTSLGMHKPLSLTVRRFFVVLAAAAAGACLLCPSLKGLGLFLGFYLGGLAGTLSLRVIEDLRLKPAFRNGWRDILFSTAQTALKGSLAVIMIIVTLSTIYAPS
jgi:hypothetical protein